MTKPVLGKIELWTKLNCCFSKKLTAEVFRKSTHINIFSNPFHLSTNFLKMMVEQRHLCPWGRKWRDFKLRPANAVEKQWLIDEIRIHGQTATMLQDKHGIDRGIVAQWHRRYMRHGILHRTPGAPKILTETVRISIESNLSGNNHNRTAVEFDKFVQEAHKENVSSYSTVSACSIKKISRRSLVRIEKEIGIRTGNAEQTTDAREKACADKRNAVSTAVGHSMVTTSALLMFNADGTSFQTGGGLTELVRVKYLPLDQEMKEGPLKVSAQRGASLVAYFIKLYLFCNAFGISGSPIFIVADSNMDSNQIDVHEVPGLGIGSDINAKAYVVFCQTRSANVTFYRWFITDIFVKFVSDIRVKYNLQLSEPAYFCLDGESDQINPLKETAILKLCEDHNIIIGKPPASTTAITQPLDRGSAFKGAKAKKKSLKGPEDKEKYMEITMTDLLKKMITSHEVVTGKKFQNSHKSLLISGLQQVRYLLGTTLTPQTLIKSFILTGQWDPKKGGCDVERILGQCTSKFTVEEVTKVWQHLPILLIKMREQGELFESDFEPLGFHSDAREGTKSRDDLVLNRRRFVFLTHPALLQREEDKRVAKVVTLSANVARGEKRKADAAAKKLIPKRVRGAQAIIQIPLIQSPPDVVI